jgi:hypothetical protein
MKIKRRAVASAAIVLGVLGGGCASGDRAALGPDGRRLESLAPGWDRFFDMSWQAGERWGRPVVSGRILNRYGDYATRVQLLVDGLDDTGAVVGQQVAWLFGEVPPHSSVWFEVPAPGRFPHYRVSIFAFDWLQTPKDGFRHPL